WGRPPPPPLAERRAHRRADDPTGRVIEARLRGAVPRHASLGARAGALPRPGARRVRARLDRGAAHAIGLLLAARHRADAAGAARGGPPARDARLDRAHPRAVDLHRARAAPRRCRSRRLARRRHGSAALGRAHGADQSGLGVRPEDRRARLPDRPVHVARGPSGGPRGTSVGRPAVALAGRVGRPHPSSVREAHRHMASEPEPAPRAQSLLTLGALALMLSAAALGFGRVFSGGGATLRLVAAAVASAAVATLLERRNLLVATIVSGALLVVAIGLLVFPQATLWGLPAGRT